MNPYVVVLLWDDDEDVFRDRHFGPFPTYDDALAFAWPKRPHQLGYTIAQLVNPLELAAAIRVPQARLCDTP